MANLLQKIDDNVKHIFREHNEADHWANVGAEGQRKVVVDRKSNAATWKAVKGFWDGSCKDDGKSGCGVAIKGSRQRKMGHDQQKCSPSESWHGHGGRDDGCVRAHGNLGSDFPQMSVCAEYQPMYWHNSEETMRCLVCGCKATNDVSRR